MLQKQIGSISEIDLWQAGIHYSQTMVAYKAYRAGRRGIEDWRFAIEDCWLKIDDFKIANQQSPINN
jgi:hypothetical protein